MSNADRTPSARWTRPANKQFVSILASSVIRAATTLFAGPNNIAQFASVRTAGVAILNTNVSDVSLHFCENQ